jgi:hypothetical protein
VKQDAALQAPTELASPSTSAEIITDRVPTSEIRPSGLVAFGATRVANYAELHGGSGRDVFFRPDRYQLSDLGPVDVAVEVRICNESHRCELCDVSQNGVAFEWPLELAVEIGAILNEIVVRFDEHEAYRGAARVSSVRRKDGRTIVGVSFVDTLMNIEDVLHLRDVKAWLSSTGSKGTGMNEAPWRTTGQERFKALTKSNSATSKHRSRITSRAAIKTRRLEMH